MANFREKVKYMIIGRKRELETLERVYKSKKPEFIAVYGRRRVGKTFLIREFFKTKKCLFFHATGTKGSGMNVQLTKFTEALSQAFFNKVPIGTPKSWGDAFGILNSQIEKQEGKIVVFLDELPWLATRKSRLLLELDYYWNRHWSAMPNVILIVCGSSASWLIQKIIYNKGGLHNRITGRIKLLPFNLGETYKYLTYKGIKFNQRQVLELYMGVGGIPYYLEYAIPGLSVQQIIEMLFFKTDSPLKDEFATLFESLFENAEAYKEIVTIISKNVGCQNLRLVN